MVFSTLGPAKPSLTQEVCKISNKVLSLTFLFGTLLHVGERPAFLGKPSFQKAVVPWKEAVK